MAIAHRHLLLSIHDVMPAALGAVDRLHAHLVRHAGATPIALLVVPHHWQSEPVERDAGFKGWLRDRHRAGDEIILHGWTHRGEPGNANWLAGLKGRHLTAGEGEFLTLAYAEAARRLHDGRALLEDVIGAPVRGFVAPAWLYGDGARRALADLRFQFAEDHFRLWQPTDGRTVARGPVVTWATRSRARRISSLAFAAAARATLGSMPVVRVGVHPGDASDPGTMDSIAHTVARFARSRRAGRYIDLLGEGSPSRVDGRHPLPFEKVV